MRFRHEEIDASPPCAHLGTCLPHDLTGNGLPDVIVGGHGPYGGADLEAHREHTKLFWYENPGWERHIISSDHELMLCIQADLCDLTGNGRLDLVLGEGLGDHNVYWFEQPEDPRDEWATHLVTSEFEKYHDVAVGDVDDDGEPEIVGLSQESETVFYYDVPASPYQSSWPDDHLHVVDDDVRVEGVQIVDVDGDGRTEILAGTSVYRRPADGTDHWDREQLDPGWDDNRVAVADLDGDGDLEIVVSEGDSPTLGSHMGRVAWFDPPDWDVTFLHEDLYNPHTLQVADFTGNGFPDVYVAEMGIDGHDNPKHVFFENVGDAEFEVTVVSRGVATHEAKAVDLTGDGRLDVIGKTYGPDKSDTHVDAWYNEP